MDYRFSLTPRLIALGGFSLFMLLLLMFLLGVQLGRQMAPAGAAARAQPLPATAQSAPVPAAGAPAPAGPAQAQAGRAEARP